MNNSQLTICIPTYNRSRYLASTLDRLIYSLSDFLGERVFIFVSDNCSDDDTGSVLRRYSDQYPFIEVFTHVKNNGWSNNFQFCYRKCETEFIWLLSDDDMPVDVVIQKIIDHLFFASPSILILRPYGYDCDDLREYPGYLSSPLELCEIEIGNINSLIEKCGLNTTLISSLIFKKDMSLALPSDLSSFNLGFFYIFLQHFNKANDILYVKNYSLACKRDNSQSYIFSNIFVTELFTILSRNQIYLADFNISSILFLFFRYYPPYLLKMDSSNLKGVVKDFDSVFIDHPLYKFFFRMLLFCSKGVLRLILYCFYFVGRVVFDNPGRLLVYFFRKVIR
ncbi:glycosyltransferase [Porticoccaceae bacterium]|nr:glycosyltransferase [Porticoccaceae bacterium]